MRETTLTMVLDSARCPFMGLSRWGGAPNANVIAALTDVMSIFGRQSPLWRPRVVLHVHRRLWRA